ncbi:DUF2508 family protein [Anaeropeptidivorans aminofermentans]|uniref:DUF2508 family protein n=1 Tax=Anaeropeptidivorans aminofermentans TaxID=2934315 RepID=UPI002023E6AB|nr:DUF2508 family protein [Anaeropeptidivorans aminofermentans]
MYGSMAEGGKASKLSLPQRKAKLKTGEKITYEDYEIVSALEKLSAELQSLHNCLDNITDPVLIDSYIFEIQAINLRYKFYLERCKEKGIIANSFKEGAL